MLPKTSVYVKRYDDQPKKVSSNIEKQFGSEPAFNKKF